MDATTKEKSVDMIVDFTQIEFFTDGDLEQEKMLGDVFFAVGYDLIKILKENVEGRKGNDEWGQAAHKLKGSSAQMGMIPLSEMCAQAEKCFEAPAQEKKALLEKIESMVAQVKEIFDHRQTNI